MRRGATTTPWTTWSRKGFADGHLARRRDLRGRVPDGAERERGCRSASRRWTARSASKGKAASHLRPGRERAATPTATSPTIAGAAEVHSSGEVWAQTLWDIRKALGHKVADSLDHAGHVALGVRPVHAGHAQRDPPGRPASATAAATPLSSGGSSPTGAWASTPDRSTARTPTSAQDFHVPPNPKTHNYSQYIQGTVTDSVTGDPVGGANVYVAGLGNQLSAVTRADGTYAIGVPWGMYPGTYPKVVATGTGYLTSSQEVTVPVGDHATADFSIRRDWAETQRRRADHRLQRSRTSPGTDAVRTVRSTAASASRGAARRQRRRRSDGRVRGQAHRGEAAAGGGRDQLRRRPDRGLRRLGQLLRRGLLDRGVGGRYGVGHRGRAATSLSGTGAASTRSSRPVPPTECSTSASRSRATRSRTSQRRTVSRTRSRTSAATPTRRAATPDASSQISPRWPSSGRRLSDERARHAVTATRPGPHGPGLVPCRASAGQHHPVVGEALALVPGGLLVRRYGDEAGTGVAADRLLVLRAGPGGSPQAAPGVAPGRGR